MSAHVASELRELFQKLCTATLNASDDGLGLARQWVASLEGQVVSLLPCEGSRAAGTGDVIQVNSPFDASLAVRVRPCSRAEQDALRTAWFPAHGFSSESDAEDAEADEEAKEESAFDFLSRWARAIERHADLVTSVVAAFSGSCLKSVRQSELPRALADIRFWAGRCPLVAPDGAVRRIEEGTPLPHTCQLFVTSPVATLSCVAREVAAAFAAGWRHRRTTRVVVSASVSSGAAPIAHLLIQLALLDRDHRAAPIASLPVASPAGALGDCIVLGDDATSLAAVTQTGAALSAMKVVPRSGARGVTIVCESADNFAAAESAIESAALWCAGQMAGSAHLVLVQESVMLTFLEQLTERMSKRQIAAGPHGDVGTLVTERQQKRLADALAAARSDGADAQKLGVMVGVGGVAPVLITGAQPASALACLETQEGLDGAFLYVLSFRTAKEALKVANHAPRRLRASLWTEVPAQAWEMALGLNFRHVEVNCVRPFDPRVAALVDAPEEWLLRGNVELSSAQSGEGKPAASSAASGGLFHSEKAPSSSVKSAAAAAVAAAAKWSGKAMSERRVALRPAVAALSKELGGAAARRLEDALRGADDLDAGRAWAVKQLDFVGQVSVQRMPRGVIAFLIDANFGLVPLCEAVLRALLFGNAVVLVTARSHAAAITRCGLAKLDAVAVAAYPEDSPNAASEALATELGATSGLAALLFACSLPPARLLGRAAVAKGPRALCLERWSQDGVSGEEAEMLQEMCVQHRAIWNPVFDAFAN